MPLALVLTYLPQILSAGKTLWDFVSKIRETAQQSAEWTPEHEAQFQAALLAMGNAQESQSDKLSTIAEDVKALLAATAPQIPQQSPENIAASKPPVTDQAAAAASQPAPFVLTSTIGGVTIAR